MTPPNRFAALWPVLALALCLTACATQRPAPPAATNGTMAPYQANGVWYRPREEPHYDAVGVASWYGAQYNGRHTADGERFDMDRPSAAHPTLPLPCLVEVTNLDNGRRIQVRVNDRGPFATGRILDLSRQAAKDLGFYEKGSARVRVRYIGPAPAVGGGRIETAAFAPAPAAPRTPLPVVGTAPSPIDAGAVRMQAGVFAERANAERAAGRFAAGEAAIEPMDRGGARLWRVVVIAGAGESAPALRARISAAGFPNARPAPPAP